MTSDLFARLAYSTARRRHARRVRDRGAPTVVFAIPKSGSTSVAAALRGASDRHVFHVHDLDPAVLTREEAGYHWSGRPWRVWDAQQLLHREPTARRPWRVVSLVRDPIAQSISAFFQPGLRKGSFRPDSSVAELRAAFGDRLDRLALHWFETHLEASLGIDVYQHEFDPEVGHAWITTPAVRLLLLRCEDLARAGSPLAELIGRPAALDVGTANVGAEKPYGDLYRRFLAALSPTDRQLDLAYGSRLVQHFYGADEIDRFRARWTLRAAPNGDWPEDREDPHR